MAHTIDQKSVHFRTLPSGVSTTFATCSECGIVPVRPVSSKDARMRCKTSDKSTRTVRQGETVDYGHAKLDVCSNPHCIVNHILDGMGTHQFQVHHKDGNPLNNESYNLTPVCTPCHLEIEKVARAYLWAAEKENEFKAYIKLGLISEAYVKVSLIAREVIKRYG